MLSFISLLLLSISIILTAGWRNAYYIVDITKPEQVERRERVQGTCQKYSVIVTIISFFLPLVVWGIEWFNIWGLVATLFALWTAVYFYICYKKSVSPLEGKVVNNRFYNYLITEIPFYYLYAFTWVHLFILSVPLFY